MPTPDSDVKQPLRFPFHLCNLLFYLKNFHLNHYKFTGD
jgi:hypothetical protein